MNCRILSVPRKHSYLPHLCAVLPECCDDSDSFVIACGGETIDHVPDGWRPFAAPLLGKSSRPDPYRRIASMRNFARCVRDLNSPVLVVEDDVVATRDLARKLRECVSACDRIVERYVLSLYCTQNLSERPVEHIDAARWYGSQAVYFPASIVKLVSEKFDRELIDPETRWCGNDILIGEFAVETGTPLFVSNGSLFQHRGSESTGLSVGMHSSPTFTL